MRYQHAAQGQDKAIAEALSKLAQNGGQAAVVSKLPQVSQIPM